MYASDPMANVLEDTLIGLVYPQIKSTPGTRIVLLEYRAT